MFASTPILRSLPIGLAAALLFMGCGVEHGPLPRSGGTEPVEDLRILRQSVTPPCTVNVEGVGAVHIEDEYVAGVVACENGNAPMEALKAQAIQARGYLYYVLSTGRTTIRNSEADQVFSCSYTTPGPRHYEAARATRGQYLRWEGQLIAPFYVAGAIPANQNDGSAEEACVGAGGNDPTSTERWVTYNLGRSGCDIDMTPLGWVPDDGNCNRNPQNRGCASQNGQTCLARRGWFHHQMFPYYYGDDVQIALAGGSCGGGSSEPPNYDAYCMRHNEDSYCIDPTARVICNGDVHTEVQDCPGGCFLGECLSIETDIPNFCEEKGADGWYCYGPTVRVHCVDEGLAGTEVCTLGCADDLCIVPEETDDDEEGPSPAPSPPQDHSPPDSDSPADPSSSILLTVSPGIDGGCSQTSGSPSPLFALVALLGTLALRRRTQRRA